MKNFFLGIAAFLAFAAPLAVFAQDKPLEAINARILPSIWYSALSTEDGKSIDVHAGIQNNSDLTFSGTAFLYVDDTLVGQKDFTSPAGALQDIFITWKATAGQHVFQVKISAAIPADKDLVSYKSDLSYMSVSNTLSFEAVKNGVADTASSVTSSFVEKADEIADNLVQSLEAAKKPVGDEKSAVSDAASSQDGAKPSIISSILSSDQAAAVFNSGIDVLAFLIHQWRWTLSALALLGIFIFLKSKAVF